jgi:hypothetical protein
MRCRAGDSIQRYRMLIQKTIRVDLDGDAKLMVEVMKVNDA